LLDREILSLELDALARLVPKLHGMAEKLNAPTPLPEMAADTPTLLTAMAVSAEPLSAFRTKVAQRFTTLGDRVNRARTEFAHADAMLAAVITGSNIQEPPASMAVHL
jgi:hypothetical protein